MKDHISRRSLGPLELKTAADAFERALEHSSAIEVEMDPHSLRKTVASAVMKQVLAGEDDGERLQKAATQALREVGRWKNGAVLPKLESRHKNLP